jgi:hypothetical protein
MKPACFLVACFHLYWCKQGSMPSFHLGGYYLVKKGGGDRTRLCPGPTDSGGLVKPAIHSQGCPQLMSSRELHLRPNSRALPYGKHCGTVLCSWVQTCYQLQPVQCLCHKATTTLRSIGSMQDMQSPVQWRQSASLC